MLSTAIAKRVFSNITNRHYYIVASGKQKARFAAKRKTDDLAWELLGSIVRSGIWHIAILFEIRTPKASVTRFLKETGFLCVHESFRIAILGRSALALQSSKQSEKQEVKNMTSLLLDAIQVVKSVNDSSSNINTVLAATINKLEQIFNSSHPHTPEDFHTRIEEIVKQSEQLKLEFQKTQNLQLQFKSCKLFRESLNNFITHFQEFLPSNFLKDYEDIEYEIKSVEADTAVRLAIMEIIKVIDIDSGEEVSFSVLKNIYKFLSNLLEVTESYTDYVPENLLEITKLIAEKFLESLDKHQLEDENKKEYLINSKASAKAILWDTSNYQKKSKKRFKTVDDLFEYWNEKYDEEEVEKSLEALMEGIDSERRRQGGRTLFS